MQDIKGNYIYENIISSLTEGVLVIGFDGKVAVCNNAVCDILEISRDRLIDNSIASIMQTTKKNDKFFEAILDALFEKERMSKIVPWIKDYEIKYYMISTSVLMQNNEKIALIVVIADHTEQTNLLIDNKNLAERIECIMNSFVEVLITAIEEKSTYNANHTKSMVRYAIRYIGTLQSEGKLTDYTEDKLKAFLMSVWLHDIGKLLIPPEIMDKPTRLGDAYERVFNRIEIGKLMLRILSLEGIISEDEAKIAIKDLDEAFELIRTANTAGFLEDDIINRIEEISKMSCYLSDGTQTALLTPGEKEALCVRKGTLTDAERAVIESHVVLTSRLLSKMQFSANYEKVPEWAGGHHELLDGSGYPNHLKGDEIPWETRILTIIDVYDALTAEDRPYKKPLEPQKAFDVLKDMANKGKIDRELLESFIESKAWRND